MRSVVEKRRHARRAVMTMCRNPLAHANCWRKFVITCNKSLRAARPAAGPFEKLATGYVVSRESPAFGRTVTYDTDRSSETRLSKFTRSDSNRPARVSGAHGPRHPNLGAHSSGKVD